MKKLSTWKLAFSILLLAVLALAAAPAVFAKAAPDPCAWEGNCPVNLCPQGSTGPIVGTCVGYEPCTDCTFKCKVRVVNGVQCKTNCWLY